MNPAVIGSSMAALLLAALPYPAHGADAPRGQKRAPAAETESHSYPAHGVRVSGRASVIDGRTLWFPKGGHRVRLASIDACELPQWAYDPRQHGERLVPKPVPCGPLAQAWLKRTVGNAPVTCTVQTYDGDGALVGRCTVRGRDLALEMLRVGWAKVSATAPAKYLAWQNHAMSARYGMWSTYVLDMPEWRAKAVDRTLSRRPTADFNLLAERESEISPPFDDARRRPGRTDR